jgi:hypothetical protein
MSTFANLIDFEGDHDDDWQSWRQRQLELEEQYEEQMMYEKLNPVPAANCEEEMLDRRERAADINSVGRSYY